MNNELLSPDEALAQAKSFSKKGRIKEAIQLYQSILASFPRHKKARKELKSLEKRNAGSPQARLHQNMSKLMRLYSEGATEKALSLATLLTTQYSDQPLPLNIAGALNLEKDRPELAVDLFMRAIQIEPTYADAHSNLAHSLLKLERFELACEHYEIALTLSPRDADLHYQLGQAKRSLEHRKDALKQWQTALDIDPKHSKSIVAIGYLYTVDRQFEQAEEQFLKAIEIDPGSMGALRGLGYASKIAGRYKEAIVYLERALSLSRESSEAVEIRFMLSGLQGNSMDTAPRSYVADLFDGYAENFEEHLVKDLEYDTPKLLQAALSMVVTHIPHFSAAIDLGCGTGLCGVAFRDIVGSIDGVDISKKMVERAREKGVYRNLWPGDVLDVLAAIEEKYQLVIAADVFIYIGNLELLFNKLKQRMMKDSYFTFSTEHSADGEFALGKSLRYTHSRAYIERIANNAGFDLVHFETHNLRKENQQWITGGAYILHKP
jgi:predicted TPR repeat methyltransferase